MDELRRRRFGKFEAYVTKCVAVVLCCFAGGLYLLVWEDSLLPHLIGGVFGLAGFFMLAGLYANLRGITTERLRGRLKIVCEVNDLQKGKVSPQEQE